MRLTSKKVEDYFAWRTDEELSMYDFIIGATLVIEMDIHNDKVTNDLQKGLDWFKENNIKAYMALID